MKKISVLLIALISSLSTFAQNHDRYVVYLTDKNNSPFSISTPLAFLSQRSVDRRTNQNIAVTTNDLPVNPQYIQDIANTGATILNVSKWLNTVTFQTNDSNVLAAVNALPFVQQTAYVGRPVSNTTKNKFAIEEAQANGPIYFEASVKSNAASKVMTLNYGPSYHQINMMNGDYLHNNGFTGNGMRIAVLDAGFLNVDIMPAFDSLRAQNKILATYDFVNHETNVYNDNSHGAMCFSIMGGNLPGVYVGSAPQAEYILLVSEDAATEYLIEEYNWASAAEYADSMGADVLTTSLGYSVFDDSTQNHTYAQMDGKTAPLSIAATIAAQKGMVVLNSAGNTGNSLWNFITVPADADSILAVGAVDSLAAYASFSGNGPSYDGRVKPDVSCQGQDTYVVSPWDNSVFSGSGTSFSCPLLAGLTACFWQSNPGLKNMEVVDFIKRCASVYNTPDTMIGYGIPDFIKAITLTGISNIDAASESFAVFPNPSSTQFNLQFENTDSENALVQLFDLQGRKLFEKNTTANYGLNSINIKHNLSSGLYIVSLTLGEKTITAKVIVE